MFSCICMLQYHESSLIISVITIQNLVTYVWIWFQQLEAIIKARVPGIMSLTNKRIDDIEEELDRLGKPTSIDNGVRLFSAVIFLHAC